MLNCIVSLRIFNGRNLWVIDQKSDQRAIRHKLSTINSLHNGSQPLTAFSCSASVILNPSLSFQWIGLYSYLKFHWWMFFSYLVAAFAKIAASKEHSLTQLYVGGSVGEKANFSFWCKVIFGTIKPLEGKMIFSAYSMPCRVCHKHSHWLLKILLKKHSW